MPGQIEQDPGTEPESVITQGQNVIILFFLATIYIDNLDMGSWHYRKGIRE